MTLTGLGDAGAHSPPQLNLNTDRAGLSFGLVQRAGPVVDLNKSSPRSRTRMRLSSEFGGEAGVTGVLTDTVQPNRVVTYGETTD